MANSTVNNDLIEKGGFMSVNSIKKLSIFILLSIVSSYLNAVNRIDAQRPDAPYLSAYGDFNVGVRKLDFVIPNQLDVVNVSAESDLSLIHI